MADEKVNSSPEEVNAAEPEVMEQATMGSPPEAAAPEPEMTEPAADRPTAAGLELEIPNGDAPPQVDGPEPEQLEVAEDVAEEPPTQASLFGEEVPAAEQPEPLAPGGDGEVVVSFEQISELISTRNKAAREVVEREASDAPSQRAQTRSRRNLWTAIIKVESQSARKNAKIRERS